MLLLCFFVFSFYRNQPLVFLCLRVVDLSYFQKWHIQISTIIWREVRGNFARNTPCTPHDSLLVYWQCGEFHGRYIVYIRGTSLAGPLPTDESLRREWNRKSGPVFSEWYVCKQTVPKHTQPIDFVFSVGASLWFSDERVDFEKHCWCRGRCV